MINSDGSDAVPAEGIAVRIDAGKPAPAPIAEFLFGGFIEHIGDLINHSLWSEVLDDRKFFHEVGAQPPPVPEEAIAKRSKRNAWKPVGPDSCVRMDETAPYVGAHCPYVRLAGDSPRGIRQGGLELGAKAYVGRVVIAAEPGARISATLSWGPGDRDRQTVKIPAGPAWTTVPIAFDCRAAGLEGSFEITGLGIGSFKVGAVSLMPADNLHGFRPDTVALMKEMDCGILRMPGGNFVSGYDWKHTIGDPDKRPPILDPVWGAVQPNDVGFDELIRLCRLIGAEPYWCVNTGFGEPRSGAELVEYANGSSDTPWGAVRAANGHPEPYRIRYWNVGNEMYGHWQLGHMAPKQYAIKHGLFAQAMRAVDPSIYIVVPGGFADEMTTGQGIIADSGNRLVEFGSERDWAGCMLERCAGGFDALATHTYPPENKRFDLATGKNLEVEQTLAEWARAPADRIATMADCWEEYKRRFPFLREGGIKVFFDEWAYRFKRDYRSCLAIARALHEFFRHTDFIDMAGYTMATAWLDCDRTQSCLSAQGLVFQLYKRRFGRIPLAVSGNSPVPAPGYPIGGDQPRINSGSDTWPLDVSAALSVDRRVLTLAVANASDAPLRLRVEIANARVEGKGRAWKMRAAGLDSQNLAGRDPEVALIESGFDAGAEVLEIGAYGIELYEYALLA